LRFSLHEGVFQGFAQSTVMASCQVSSFSKLNIVVNVNRATKEKVFLFRAEIHAVMRMALTRIKPRVNQAKQFSFQRFSFWLLERASGLCTRSGS
jgi:hypothetical protein